MQRTDGYAVKCLPESPFVLTIALTTFITILDITTDIMGNHHNQQLLHLELTSVVVSIPIIILRRTKIKTRQKFVLGAFLCLSLVMIIVALTRISAYRLRGVIDLTWQIFWQHMEGCVAMIMASITAFRTAFITVDSRREKVKHQGPSYSMRQRLKAKLMFNRSDEANGSAGQENLPAVPQATLTGMRTFIRKNNRSAGGTTAIWSEHDHLEEDDHKAGKIDQGVVVEWELNQHTHGVRKVRGIRHVCPAWSSKDANIAQIGLRISEELISTWSQLCLICGP